MADVVEDMMQRGLLSRVSAQAMGEFLAGEGLRVLFFTGGERRHREAHDVAVALREVLLDCAGQLSCGVIDPADEQQLQEQFRVVAPPALVFLVSGLQQEVLPGVRDWADYQSAFQRYLGRPQREMSA